MAHTKQRMEAQLPPTLCTSEMRDKVVHLAERQGKSIGQLQREALSLFLRMSDSKAIENGSSIIREGV